MKTLRSLPLPKLLLLVLAGALLLAASYLYLPVGIDWRDTYRPAIWAIFEGRSPFSVDIYFASPWGLLPLLPFALLPERLGRAVLFLVGAGVYAFTAHKLGAKPLALAAFLLSPPVMHGLLNANVEWLPLLGFVLPPQIGLLFVSIKPQIGIGIALFWVVEAWRKGGWREVVRICWPVCLAIALSFALYGLWPLRFGHSLTLSQTHNASLWPSSLPIGLVLLVTALSQRKANPAMAASPFLSPYVLLHTWVGALASLLPSTSQTLAAVAGLWLLILLRGFGLA